MATPAPRHGSQVSRKTPPVYDGVTTTYHACRTQFKLWLMITDAAEVEQGPLTVISGLSGQPQVIGLAIPPEVLGRGSKKAAGPVHDENGTLLTPEHPEVKSGIQVLLDALDAEYEQEAEDREYELNNQFMDLKQERGETATSYSARFSLALTEARAAGFEMSKSALGSRFLNRSNLSDQEKKLVLSGCAGNLNLSNVTKIMIRIFKSDKTVGEVAPPAL